MRFAPPDAHTKLDSCRTSWEAGAQTGGWGFHLIIGLLQTTWETAAANKLCHISVGPRGLRQQEMLAT